MCVGEAWNGVSSPCKGCTKRHTKCHSKCPEYKAYAEENKRIREAKQRDSHMDFNPNIRPKGGR